MKHYKVETLIERATSALAAHKDALEKVEKHNTAVMDDPRTIDRVKAQFLGVMVPETMDKDLRLQKLEDQTKALESIVRELRHISDAELERDDVAILMRDIICVGNTKVTTTYPLDFSFTL